VQAKIGKRKKKKTKGTTRETDDISRFEVLDNAGEHLGRERIYGERLCACENIQRTLV
jgi:hypothetical protein